MDNFSAPFEAPSEATVRLGVFIGIFLVMAIAEALLPRRDRLQSRTRRWSTNIGMVIIDSLVVRFTFPLVAVGAAAIAQEKGWGLLNLIDAPLWAEALAAIIVLDGAIYLQHVIAHKVPIFWQLHQVHHADRDLDVSSGARFHPIEIVLSMAYKMVIVVALGASPLAVIIFEIVLNAMAMFNHANFDLGPRIDRWLRMIIVTPDMHRVHHSVIRNETDSNYGFNLSIWDRLFRTYRPQPKLGHIDMVIGLPPHQNDNPSNLLWSLLLPFKRLKKPANKS